MEHRWSVAGSVLGLLAGACSSPSSMKDDAAPVNVDVSGAAAKGPLLAGSPITVHMIDAAAHPTGTNYNTTTKDDLGRFDLVVSSTGDAELQADGFYFNELTGGLSTSQITLFALAPIESGPGQQIYVNSYTHMSEAKAKKLMEGGMPMSAAIEQAESDLRAGLGVFVPGTIAAGTSLDLLGGDTDANAYLLALSCTLAQASGGSDAMLQQLINMVALNLASGTPFPMLQQPRRFLDVDACVGNLQSRLASATLPNIDRALDFDGDGISDFADPDADGDGIPATADTIVGAATNGVCTFAIDSGGSVWAWSRTFPGISRDCMALGDGMNGLTVSHHNPLPIQGLSGAQVVVFGNPNATAYAVKTDGTLVSWNSFAAPAAVSSVTGLRITPGALASGTEVYAVKTDGTLLQIGTGPVSGVSGVLAVAIPTFASASLVLQHTDGTIAILTILDGSTVAVTGVGGVTTAGAISATQNIGFAISNGDVYSFPMSGATIAATKVNGLPSNGIVSLNGGYAVDQSGQVWDISTPTSPTQLMSGVSRIATTGVPLLYTQTDGSLWEAGQGQAGPVQGRRIRVPR